MSYFKPLFSCVFLMRSKNGWLVVFSWTVVKSFFFFVSFMCCFSPLSSLTSSIHLLFLLKDSLSFFFVNNSFMRVRMRNLTFRFHFRSWTCAAAIRFCIGKIQLYFFLRATRKGYKKSDY